jgi:hypothetical protein
MGKPCLLTFWNLTHVILYAVLGFVFPQYWWLLMLVGALWECLENFVAHNTPMDIVWNATGLLIGAAVRMMMHGRSII